MRKRRGVSGTSQLNVSSIVNTPNAMSFYSKVRDFFKLEDRPGSGLQPQRPGLSPEQTLGTPTPGETFLAKSGTRESPESHNIATPRNPRTLTPPSFGIW